MMTKRKYRAGAGKAYYEAKSLAWKVRCEAIDQADKAYQEAIAQAWKVYEEARLCD
jgi:hypothetical protein